MNAIDNIRKAAEAEGYELAHYEESIGGDRATAIVLLVKMSNRKICDADQSGIYKGTAAIKLSLDTVSATMDPKGPETRARYRKQVEDIYKDAGVSAVYIEALPNGYCPSPCCLNKPWFRVTSSIGHVVIGWRKNVMSIDWEGTTIKASGEDLFPDESSTKLNRGIHAWGTDKATEYVRCLHEAVK